MSASTTTNAYSITIEGENQISNSFCCTDPYVTAETYRKYTDQQRQLLLLETPNSNTNSDVHYRVYYVNERPYIPQWRVEIVKDASENNNYHNNSDDDNNNNDIDPYQSVKAVAAAIMLLQRRAPQLHDNGTTNTPATSTLQPITTTTTTTEQYVPDIHTIQNITNHLSVQRVMGGVTNTLYKVSGFQTSSTASVSTSSTTTTSSSSERLSYDDDYNHVLVFEF